MGIDEAVETITGMLLVLGALPFVMAWLERTLDEQKAPGRRRWNRRASPPPGGTDDADGRRAGRGGA